MRNPPVIVMGTSFNLLDIFAAETYECKRTPDVIRTSGDEQINVEMKAF